MARKILMGCVLLADIGPFPGCLVPAAAAYTGSIRRQSFSTCARQRPLKVASRFSRKAPIPSLLSSVL